MLKLKLYEKTDTVWVDDGATAAPPSPYVPVNVTRDPPRLVSQLRIPLERHSGGRGRRGSNSNSDSKRVIADALSNMKVAEQKQSMIIQSILTRFNRSRATATGVVELDWVINTCRKRRRSEMGLSDWGPSYVCVTATRYNSELETTRRCGWESKRETTCAICREEFAAAAGKKTHELLVYLPCSASESASDSHVFHVKCIDKWLETRPPSCPLCRSPLRRRFNQSVFM